MIGIGVQMFRRVLTVFVVMAIILVVCIIIGLLVIQDMKAAPAHFNKILIGMTQAEVESILGKGTPLKRSEVPETSIPVVAGDEFLAWNEPGGIRIIVAFVGGRVSDKWYWKPAL